ncbi:MAG: DsbA family protein [Patescibacteria group bacterium]
MDKPSVFDVIGPGKTFGLGIVTAILIICTIGFFVLLSGKFDGTATAKSTDTTQVVKTGTQPTPTQPTAPQPAGTGEIQLAAVTESDWVKGNRNAKISIVEFSDTECPFCKRFHPTMQQVIDTYGDDVNWVYRHFPLDSLHPTARKEAEATECAGELAGNDGFWAYLDRLFEVTPSNNGLQLSQLPQIAEDVGINRAKFEECLDSGRHANAVQEEYQQAVAAGGRGTPYSVLVVGDENIPVSGAVPFEQLKSIIDSQL